MKTTEAECLEALRKAADELGESPTKSQYEELDITPASTTILRIIGGWNEPKERADLERYRQGQSGGTDIQPKPEWVELPDGREWDELTSQQRWYYKNREQRIQRKEERRDELYQWFYRYKKEECQCARCGEGDPACLDFRHPGKRTSAFPE